MAEEETTTEEWRPVPIPEFAALYSVSNMGRVRRDGGGMGATVGRILKTQIDRDGYPRVHLARPDGGKSRISRRGVHQLVAGAFLGPTPKGKTIDHKDGVKTNNRSDNFRFLTNSEQAIEAGKLGLLNHEKGETHHAAVLADADIPLVRRLLADGVLQRDVAERFGVTQTTISQIATGKTWVHVPVR